VRFEWDPEKALLSRGKHMVSFEEPRALRLLVNLAK
jgi:uncharacterized DUF497 family protein